MLCDVMSSHLVQYYSVLRSTTPVLQSTTRYYSSTTKHYSNLLPRTTRYYSVLQSDIQVLQSNTQVLLRYISVLQSTTPYYKVLLQYYKVLLQYYKVHFQYYSVLQSTTPVLQGTLPVLLQYYYKVLLQYYKVLLQYYSACHKNCHLTFTKYCPCHEKWHLTFTKCCACHTEWLACLILVTFETSFPMRGATNVTLQTHQILRLPRKMTIQHLAEICWKQLKRHFQCAADPRPFREWSETVPTMNPSVRNPPRNRGYLSRSGRACCIEKYNISRSGYLSKFHQVLRLPRKVTLDLHLSTAPVTKSATWPSPLRLSRKVPLDLNSPSTAPVTKSDTWPSPSTAPATKSDTWPSPSTAPVTKSYTWLHQVLHLPRRVTLDLHQVLRLPHRMTRMLDPRHIWNVISNARSNKCHPPNSPNTAPATQNDHPTSGRNLLKTAETSFPMRGRSETVPRMIRDRSDHEPISPQPAAQQRLPFALRTSMLYWKIQHFALRLSFQISPSTAPATKSDTWPSPSTAPVTQNDSHAWSSSPLKRHFQCEEQQMSPSKLTKYCACHAKWPSNISQKFAENSWNVISNARPIRPWSDHDPRPFPSVRNPPRNRAYLSRSGRAFCIEKYNISRSGYLSKFHQVLRLPRKVTLDLHQVLRLSRKVPLDLNSPSTAPVTKSDTWPSPSTAPATKSDTWPSPSTAPVTKSDTWPSPSTAPATKSDTWPSPSTAPVTKSDAWPSPSTAPVTKSYTWPAPSTAPATQNDSHAWSSSHMKRHFQCEEQQMSPSKLTKYCACHAKWPSNISQKFAENSWNVISNARPIRPWSDHDPTMIRPWSETVPVSPQPAAQQSLPFALRTSILYWKIQHFALRLSFQISPSTAPATKSDTWPSPSTAPVTKSATWPSPSTAPVTKSDTWPSPSTAPATKSDTWPSPSTAPVTKSDTWPSPSTAPATKSYTWPAPSTAPATQNDSHAWSSSHMKRHFQCEEQQMSPSKDTKYCACHAKWPSNISQKFAENSWNVISNARPIRPWSDHDPTMIRPWSETVPVIPQPAAQQSLPFALRTSILYWKIQHFALRLSFQIPASTAPATKSDTGPSPSTAPATKSDTWPLPSTAPATKNDTWPSPSTAPATKSDTWPSPSSAPATKSDTHAWTSSHMITWLYYY